MMMILICFHNCFVWKLSLMTWSMKIHFSSWDDETNPSETSFFFFIDDLLPRWRVKLMHVKSSCKVLRECHNLSLHSVVPHRLCLWNHTLSLTLTSKSMQDNAIKIYFFRMIVFSTESCVGNLLRNYFYFFCALM